MVMALDLVVVVVFFVVVVRNKMNSVYFVMCPFEKEIFIIYVCVFLYTCLTEKKDRQREIKRGREEREKERKKNNNNKPK